ncbi:MAG: ATP-binding protein [Candidatus Omnitrophica bacterium]|nr:ATP-binding protein [Candidatus Omnitrophota bacterium]
MGLKLFEIKDFVKTNEYNILKQDLDSWYIFVGKTGTGKTYLAKYLFNFKAERNLKCKYISFKRFMFEYRDILQKKYTDYSELDFLNEYVNYDLLILDEIDKTTKTESEKSMLFEILSERYDLEKQTILISNTPLKYLKTELFDEAIVDRLMAISKVIEFTGENFRKKRKEVSNNADRSDKNKD